MESVCLWSLFVISLIPTFHSGRDGLCPIHLAAEKKNVKLISILKKYKANVSASMTVPKAQSSNAIFSPASTSADKRARRNSMMLLEANVKALGDDLGLQAIHIASLGGDLATTSALIEAGADVNALHDSIPPLCIAIRKGNADVTEYLLNSGAKPDVYGKHRFLSSFFLLFFSSDVLRIYYCRLF